MADVFLGTAMGTYVVGRFAEKGIYTATDESSQTKTQDAEPEKSEGEKSTDETSPDVKDESESGSESESTEDYKKQ